MAREPHFVVKYSSYLGTAIKLVLYILKQLSLPHLYIVSYKCWENVLFKLRSERVTCHFGSSPRPLVPFPNSPHPGSLYCTHPRPSRFPRSKMAAGISARAQNRYASAGHPPPLLSPQEGPVDPSGLVRPADKFGNNHSRSHISNNEVYVLLIGNIEL